MNKIQRIYQFIINEHLQDHANKIILLVGPRQVGKTTLGNMCLNHQEYHNIYLNWDLKKHQKLIKSGIKSIIQKFSSDALDEQDKINVIYFDELQKYKQWKSLLRGYHSKLTEDCRIMVTGSAKMEVYKTGRSSLKGICLLYRVFPLSVAEIVRNNPKRIGVNEPIKIDDDKWNALLRFGGFPDPYLTCTEAYYNKWSKDRDHLLLDQDLTDINTSIDVKNISNLIQQLKSQVKHQVKYNTLADNFNVKEEKIKNWISLLENLYYCFSIQPWYRSKAKTLKSNPKIYLWDWAELSDQAARFENLVAIHLKKAIEFWNDNGGKYELYYLQSPKGEVDFYVIKDNKPWSLVEVKSSKDKIHKALNHFNNNLKAPHVLQVTGDMPYEEIDCFSLDKTEVVPMITFLSQLV